MRFLVAVVGCVLAACHSMNGPSSPASAGVRAYVDALRAKDPHDAYALLSSDTRKKVSFDKFALDWKQSEKERDWQAKELEESLKGSPDVGERALVSFADGKLVQLEREGVQWRMEAELVGQSRAKKPRDAIRAFAEAIDARDIGRILAVLTQRRREGLQRQIVGFVNGIDKRINDKLDENGDKAELRWDDNGIRYRILLRKEDGEWRVDDIYIRPVVKEDEPSEKTIDPIPEDF